MSKHTSGPWRIRYGGMPGDDGFGIEACNAIQSHVAMVAECWPCNVTGNEHREELAANARLIAAAPALLAALREVEWGAKETHWGIEFDCCPTCGYVSEIPPGTPEEISRHISDIGHAPDCQLAAAIKLAEGEA